MKGIFDMIRRWDIIVILLLIGLSFLPLFIFSLIQANRVIENPTTVAVITVDNQEVKRVTLTDNLKEHILNVPEIDCNPNTVQVSKESIRIRKSTCPEQICVRTGYISKSGQTIICLPHKVIIEIETVNGSNDEMIISS